MGSRTLQANWPEAIATVLSCTYTARAGRAIAFGLPSSKHFRITYNYWAEGSLRTGEFFAEKPIPQGSLVHIRYDPEEPTRNQHNQIAGLTKVPLLAFGVAGSVALSLVWLLVLHGCR